MHTRVNAIVAACVAGMMLTGASAPPTPRKKPAPVVNTALGQSEALCFENALAAISAKDWIDARRARACLTDSAASAIVTWQIARNNETLSFGEMDQLRRELSDWPRVRELERRMQARINNSGWSSSQKIRFLEELPELTGDGKAALALAYAAAGRDQDARRLAEDVFRSEPLSADAEALIWGQFGPGFSNDAIAARADLLSWQRRDYSRYAGRLDPGFRSALAARSAARAGGRKAAQIVAAVPSAYQEDPGLLFERAVALRRAGKVDAALNLLLRADGRLTSPAGREALHGEKRLQIIRLFKVRDYRSAYDLISKHGLTSGEDFADAEFLSGWIALRYLNDANLAERHFTTLQNGVSAPVSSARALYWRAIANQAMGRAGEAQALADQAAQFLYTFYGQLAAAKFRPGAYIELPAAGTSSSDRASFEMRTPARALNLLAEFGERELFEQLALTWDDELQTAAEHESLAELARDSLNPKVAVRTAKAGLRRGIVATAGAYPTIELPQVALMRGPEPAFTHAIIRQETEFNPRAVSPVGARGMMQLMPATAKLQANRDGEPYVLDWLTQDVDYNVSLGASHLQDLVEQFGGSYIMAIMAYNAGPGRPNQWMQDYGDPRRGEIDPVDWLELVPISETRNYVHRVMENVQVYRVRLSGQPVPLRLIEDLNRGRM